MILEQEKAIETLKNPRSKRELREVLEMESRLRVYTESLSKEEIQNEKYWSKLVDSMKFRSAKKFERVIQFARFPLPITSVSDSIITDLFKVFEGKNRHFNVDADRDISKLTQWVDEYKADIWIESNVKKVLKNKPCSFVVVDIDDKGIPYLLNIDSDRVKDALFNEDGTQLEYISFLHSIERLDGDQEDTYFYSVYDSDSFRVFKHKKSSDEYELVSENKHNIGYAPARPFMEENMNDKNFFMRRTAFSPVLAQMEDWTMFDIYRNHTDHYAPFPITESAKSKCSNPDCQDGYTISKNVTDPSKPNDVKTVLNKCPVCADKQENFIFPGTHIGVKVSADPSQKDVRGVFRMIFPETDKMKYIPQKLDALEVEIRNKTVGVNHLERTQEAVNELQMTGSFASMETVLMRYKNEFDKLYVWVIETVGRLFYNEINLKIDANFGTEFYLITEEDLQIRFQKAKTSGLPTEELLMIYIQLVETKYKGNPNKIMRQKMIAKLDPLPMFTINEAVELAKQGVISKEILSLKVNFITFVNKFEEENANITQFGSLLEMKDRLKIIRETLNGYNLELINKNKSEEVLTDDKIKKDE